MKEQQSAKMQICIKNLAGSTFKIVAHPNDTIMALKKQIEDLKGKVEFPCGLLLLIHHGKVLKDDSTVAENNITEDGFLVVMKSKSSGVSAAASSSTTKASQSNVEFSSSSTTQEALSFSKPTQSKPEAKPLVKNSESYSKAASNLVAGSDREQTIQEIIEIGGGTWDRDTVMHALRAAYNNPERAVEYLFSSIPELAEIPVPVTIPSSNSQQQIPNINNNNSQANGVNAVPLDLFPQAPQSSVDLNSRAAFDFLRDNEQFQAMRSMVQENPSILQPILQQLEKTQPHLRNLIEENYTEFLSLIFEPYPESNLDDEEDLQNQFDEELPQPIHVTPEEHAAIERLEAMGFDRGLVIEAFFACENNEELAANYLLEHCHDFDN